MVIQNTVLDEIRSLQEGLDSGILVLAKQGQRVSVSYREGLIQGASSNLDAHRIGAYLIREGYLAEADVTNVLAEAKREKILFGEAAVRRKYIDASELADVVRRQTTELLKHAITNGFVRESFSRSLNSSYASANINVAHVLLELSRFNPKPFEAAPGTVFALKNDEDLSGVPWIPKELSVLGELNTSTTIEELKVTTGLDDRDLRLILGVFDRLGMIEKVGNVADAGGARSTDPKAIIKKVPFPYERMVPKVTNAILAEKLEVVRNPSSFISEQFKTLKVRIRQDDGENPVRVLTISSPDQQDGKSLISANLALTLAMEPGRRTIIVDCDLRNPTLNKNFGVSSEPGLIHYLSNPRLSPYCFTRRIGDLFFMTSGGSADNPIELLSLRAMKVLVDRLKADFDTVILDAPPFSPIADARIISGLSDGLIMVIRRGKTSNRSIDKAFKAMDSKKLLGVVFNDVKPMLFNTYFNSGYYRYGSDSQYLYAGPGRQRIRAKNYLES